MAIRSVEGDGAPQHWLMAERLRRLLGARGLRKLRPFARQVGLDPSYLSRLLRQDADPPLVTVARLADGLGVAVWDLSSRGRALEVIEGGIAVVGGVGGGGIGPTRGVERLMVDLYEFWGSVPARAGELGYR